jgi:hypothetical protein
MVAIAIKRANTWRERGIGEIDRRASKEVKMIERKKKSGVMVFLYFGGVVGLLVLGPFMVLRVPMHVELAKMLFITTNRIPNQGHQIPPFTMTSTHGQSSFLSFPIFHQFMLLS